MGPLAMWMALTLVVVLLAIVVSALRNRVFLKLALRNIPRRPAQTALIVVGLMLSTMIIAASLGVGDTITNSIRSFVVIDGLGHTDEAIRSPTLAFLGDELFQRFDEGIRIGQRFGDGFLFNEGRRYGDSKRPNISWAYVWNCGYSLDRIAVPSKE